MGPCSQLCAPASSGTALHASGLPSLPSVSPSLFTWQGCQGDWCSDSKGSKENNHVHEQAGHGRQLSVQTQPRHMCACSPFGSKHPGQGRGLGPGSTEELLVPL